MASLVTAVFVSVLSTVTVYGQVQPPYIRTNCNLDETFGRAFCIDVSGFRPGSLDWERMTGHSCKDAGTGSDLLWGFGSNPDNTFNGNNIGQIWGTSELLADYCLAARCDVSGCTTLGVLCKNTTALSVWKYNENKMKITLVGSVDDVNGDSSSDSDSDRRLMRRLTGSNSDSSSSSSDDDDELCLRVIEDTLVQDNSRTYNIKEPLYIESCDDTNGDDKKYRQWIVFESGETDNGPDLSC